MNALHTAAAPFRLRTLVRWCVFLVLAACFVQIWLLDGLVAPCRIVGGSMAETLLGAHRNVVCDDCGCRFVCGTDSPPVATRAVCPNCGYPANDLQSLSDVNADRVLIDRTTFSIRSPRRWEVVAFRQSQQADNIVVKRVVGLPGESIEIRNGDVYADGHIQRKNLAEQRALAVLVHDANFEPTQEPTPPPRWQAEASDTRWSVTNGRFSNTVGSDREAIDWLVYRHWQRFPNLAGIQALPITDISSYDPSQTRREEDVHPVTDLMLSFRLGPMSGRGTFFVRASDGHNNFEMRLQFDADSPRYQILCNGQPIADAVGDISATDGSRLVEVSLVDQQFLLAINGMPIVTWPYDRPELPPTPSASPLAIGVQGLDVAVSDLRVYRDVYYTRPIGIQAHPQNRRPTRLDDDKYYVLGDNSPASADSRTWPEHGAVDRKLLVGKPLTAIPSISFSFGGQWHFQVPNPVKIRYIR